MKRIKRIQGGDVHLVAVGGDTIRPTQISTGGGGRTYPRYPGPTEITPSQQEQTLYTSGYRLTNDITINPIPSNYGLIIWNGSTLTVS